MKLLSRIFNRIDSWLFDDSLLSDAERTRLLDVLLATPTPLDP